MSDLTCPWCEASLDACGAEADEQQCAECLTTWIYVDAEVELALAA
jgi:hypothetical protein